MPDASRIDAAQPLAEVQEGVTWQPLGFGVTAADGTFELVTNGAQGPLNLEAGEYRCTLESVGAPIRIPGEYASPESSPLQVSIAGTGARLDLSLPARLVR